jgi:hypothetical protein
MLKKFQHDRGIAKVSNGLSVSALPRCGILFPGASSPLRWKGEMENEDFLGLRRLPSLAPILSLGFYQEEGSVHDDVIPRQQQLPLLPVP